MSEPKYKIGDRLWGVGWEVFAIIQKWEVSKKRYTVKDFFIRDSKIIYICDWYMEQWMDEDRLFLNKKDAEKACEEKNKSLNLPPPQKQKEIVNAVFVSAGIKSV